MKRFIYPTLPYPTHIYTHYIPPNTLLCDLWSAVLEMKNLLVNHDVTSRLYAIFPSGPQRLSKHDDHHDMAEPTWWRVMFCGYCGNSVFALG